MLRTLDASLARLGVEHVDLWLAHAWSDEVPLEETLSALDAAVTSGRARYVGVSNYSGWQTARAATWQQLRGAVPLVATEVEYSLVNRDVEVEVLPSAVAHGLGVLVWSPLGRGVLTGKYRHGTPADSRAASPHFAAFVERYLDAGSRQVVDALVTAAEGLDCSPPSWRWPGSATGRGSSHRSSARGRPLSCGARWAASRSRCRSRSGPRWTRYRWVWRRFWTPVRLTGL